MCRALFLGYDAAADVLILEDLQYGGDDDEYWEVTRSINTVRWNGGAGVSLAASYALDATAGSILARGAKIFYDTWDDGYQLGSIAVSNTGAVTEGPAVAVTDDYAWILDADGDDVLALVGGQLVAHYDFSADPELAGYREISTSPLAAHFGADTVYLPLGYGGMERLPR